MKKILLIFIGVYILQFILGAGVIYFVFIQQTQNALNRFINRVSEDLHYKNGTWETNKYDADPEVPGRFRLYVFTKEGFVIDRWHPVSGFLDTADFSRLLTFQTPQTINTITYQTWRMYSQPIKNKKNAIIGVIAVSYFGPDAKETKSIDQKLKSAANIIKAKLTVTNTINADRLDVRSVPYNIAFEVVDSYNSIIIQSSHATSMNRIPNFIDTSYVKQQLQENDFRQIKNKMENAVFLIRSQPLFDADHIPVGVMVAGTTITIVYDILWAYFEMELLFMTIALLIIYRVTKKFIKTKVDTQITKLKENQIKRIGFSQSEVALYINDRKIPLLYATNQYYLCVSLFSSPKKKWETDELLEKFGEEYPSQNWRKIYDAMLEINKKISEFFDVKLIIKNNKTYQINPSLLKKIVKI